MSLATLDHSTISVVRADDELVVFSCQGCQFASVPVPMREVAMWAWMHASGIAGLPGTRIGVIEESWMYRDEAEYFAEDEPSAEELEWWAKQVLDG